MTEGLPDLSVLRWLVAAAPIVALFVLVLWGKLKAPPIAVIALTIAATVAFGFFGADVELLAVGLGKGLWTGVWILCVVWPALLLYQLANRAGLSSIGKHLAGVLPTRTENLLLVAWVLPSFVQGVAGFGTPIAVAAPLLVAMGVSRRDAVALPLVGYHWSVTFGSMGSSFYMGALTARLAGEQVHDYAFTSSVILAVNALLSGVLVCLLIGGLRALSEARLMLVITGLAMGVTLIVTSQVEPSIASVSAGAAGITTVPMLRVLRRRSLGAEPAVVRSVSAAAHREPLEGRPDAEEGWGWLRVLSPYAVLLGLVLPVFVIPASRTWVKSTLLIGPSFGSTSTAYGLTNAAVDRHSPVALLGHPGTYLLAAAVIGGLAYARYGLLGPSDIRPVLGAWQRQARSSSMAVLLLAGLAGVMVDAGMIQLIAAGVVEVTGNAFPVMAGALGAVGSFATGSTTTSNALLASLQGNVASLIGVEPSTMVAAQTAGGNVGNSLAPVVILVGASAVGAVNQVGEILRRVLKPAAVLLGAATIMVAVAVWV